MNNVSELRKPVVRGPVDGNIFAVVGAARGVMRRTGWGYKVGEMMSRVMGSSNYDEALGVIMEYVEFEL